MLFDFFHDLFFKIFFLFCFFIFGRLALIVVHRSFSFLKDDLRTSITQSLHELYLHFSSLNINHNWTFLVAIHLGDESMDQKLHQKLMPSAKLSSNYYFGKFCD